MGINESRRILRNSVYGTDENQVKYLCESDLDEKLHDFVIKDDTIS